MMWKWRLRTQLPSLPHMDPPHRIARPEINQRAKRAAMARPNTRPNPSLVTLGNSSMNTQVAKQEKDTERQRQLRAKEDA